MKQGWEIKKIKDIASLITDGDWIESRHQSEDGIRLIQTGNVGNGVFKAKDDKPHYISEDTFNELGCTEIFAGDCLVSRLPEPVGRACIIPEISHRMITAVDCSIIRFKDVYLSKLFVYYTMSLSYQKDINNNTTGTTRKRISRKNLEQIPIPIPPLPEQERIVSELDLISGVIEKKKQQLKELDSLAQSIFYEMFGNPVENEKGWEREKLSNKAEISSSKRIFASEYTDSGVPFYRGKEVTEKSKGNPISVELYISHERYEEIKLNYGVPDVGDILVTAVGTIGNIWVVDSDEVFYFKDGNVLWIKIKDGTNPIYFKYILTILINEYKDMMANGCAYSALTIANLKEMPTCVIPLSLQQEFASKIEKIEKQKELIKQSLQDTETLFDSRMDFYFN